MFIRTIKLIVLCKVICILFQAKCYSQSNPPANIEINNSKGIQFSEGLSWEEIKAKAKKENKFIFVDCFATWCVPCKKMDRTIYPSSAVGDVINQRFVSVRVQMDSTENDNSETKAGYQEANYIKNSFGVKDLPTYLFFTPNGDIVHKDISYKTEEEFIKLSTDALDSSKQFFTLFQKYLCGNLRYEQMPFLTNIALRINEKSIADSVAENYLNNYLLKAPDSEILTKNNIEFIYSNTKKTSDKGFKFVYTHLEKINEVMGVKRYAQDFIEPIIRQEIYRKLWKDKKQSCPLTLYPNWKKIKLSIQHSYNLDFANRTVLDAQIAWYTSRKDWVNYCKKVILRVNRYGPFGPIPSAHFRWNWSAWALFEHSTNADQLTKGLTWSKKAISLSPVLIAGYLDTYANLLYKLSKVKEAIAWQEKAVKLEPTNEELIESLRKMKKGEKTWQE